MLLLVSTFEEQTLATKTYATFWKHFLKQTLATKTHALRDVDAGQVLDTRFFSGNGLVRSMTRNKVSSLLTRLDKVDGGQRSIASWFCSSLANGEINPLE